MPFPPPLTEEWASAYLQILFGLFVFSIGIPALLTQLIAQEEMRHFAQRKQKKWWWYTLIWVSCIASLLFVFVLHPFEGEKNEEQPWWIPYLAVGVVTFTCLLVLSMSYFLKGYERETLLGRLRKKLRKSLLKKNHLDEQSLKDIVYLGEKGNPGHEKELVLQEVMNLVDEAQTSTGYSGDQLDRILREFPTILANKEEPGNDGNFEMAARILTKIRDDFPQNEGLSTRDRITANKMFFLLGVETVKLGLDKAAFTFVQLAESGDHELLFGIGLHALRSRRYELAAMALSKLETLAQMKSYKSTDEATTHLLGLIAHFAVYGISSCRHAEKTLLILAPFCQPSLRECLNSAYQYHCENLNYDTADSIAVLLHCLGTNVNGLQQRIFPNNKISRDILFQK